MTIFKFKKRVEFKKSIGNLKLETLHYGSYVDEKYKEWTGLHLWYDNDCENCPCCLECRNYDGECEDCGCLLSKDGDFSTPILVCMLPNWIKKIILRLKGKRIDNDW